MNVTATTTAIDKATCDVTLKDPQGNEMTVTAGPKVRNFDKLKVGDQVNAKYVEALTLPLVKGGGQKVARAEDIGGVRAKAGAQPGGAVGRQVTRARSAGCFLTSREWAKSTRLATRTVARRSNLATGDSKFCGAYYQDPDGLQRKLPSGPVDPEKSARPRLAVFSANGEARVAVLRAKLKSAQPRVPSCAASPEYLYRHRTEFHRRQD